MVPDRWKGMTREQLEHICLTQKQQVQEKLVPAPPSRPPDPLPDTSLPPSGALVTAAVTLAQKLPSRGSQASEGDDTGQVIPITYDVARVVSGREGNKAGGEGMEVAGQRRVSGGLRSDIVTKTRMGEGAGPADIWGQDGHAG